MRVFAAMTAVILWTRAVQAQDPALIDQFERTLESLLESRYETTRGLTGSEHTRLLYGAYTTVSGLALDNESGSTLVQGQADARLWGEVRREGHTLYGRLRLRYREYEGDDAFAGDGSGLVEPVGDRYWYRFDWRADRRSERGEDTTWNWWTQLGRQHVHWASGLALSDVLYAARAGVEVAGVRVEGLYGITPGEFVDFDASRPNWTTDTDRVFWGAQADFRAGGHRPYAYFLDQRDGNGDEVPGFGRFGYDSSYVAVGSVGPISGQLLYRVEFLREFGDSMSDIFGTSPQTVEDITAWAGRVELVFTPHALREPLGLRTELEVLLASGDADRGHASNTIGGNLSDTDDRAFNAFGYANTGLAFGAGLSNLISVRLGASLYPLRGPGFMDELRVGLDLFAFGRMDPDAPLSVPTAPGGRYVGMEADLAIEWQVFHDLAIDVRYGIFVPGGAIPDSDPRHFAYAGVSYGF